MDSSLVIEFPRPGLAGDDDDLASAAEAAAVREIDAAIDLVASRTARRVHLTAIPFVASVAAIGLAHARASGIAFRLERQERAGIATVTIGPIEAAPLR